MRFFVAKGAPQNDGGLARAILRIDYFVGLPQHAVSDERDPHPTVILSAAKNLIQFASAWPLRRGGGSYGGVCVRQRRYFECSFVVVISMREHG
jgi:hypothetical protein